MKIRPTLVVDTRSQTEGRGRHIRHSFFYFLTNNPTRIQCV